MLAVAFGRNGTVYPLLHEGPECARQLPIAGFRLQFKHLLKETLNSQRRID